MATRTGKIILAKNIKLDRDYKNVLDYTESQMLDLVNANKVAESTNASFVRVGGNTIDVPFTYSQCINANYVAFQNPDYSNKWFFCFIDSSEYRNDGTTRITFSVDVCSTWFDYWNPKACFVQREHVNDDTVGANTVPEGLEYGEYIINVCGECETDLDSCYIAVGTTYIPDNTPSTWGTGARQYGGVYSGLYYWLFDDISEARKIFLAYDTQTKADSVQIVFMIPKKFCVPVTWFSGELSGQTFTRIGLLGSTTGAVIIRDGDINLPSQSTINGYSPKNNKLFCHPYNMLSITNNNGNTAEYHYEDFIDNNPLFSLTGSFCPGCSMKLYPTNYKKHLETASIRSGYNFGIIGGKYPQCSWQSDPYTNWLTQQAVNQGVSYIGNTITAIATTATGNIAGGVGTFAGGIASTMAERYTHSLQPPQAHGTNSGDVNFGMSQAGYTYYKMSIKAEYAKQIDDYFTRFGYQINRVKLPNQTGRRNWNYVQIGSGEDIGYSSNASISVPSDSMQTINQAYRSGITIWHSHDNLGDFSLDNSII